jgi:hypothetical protein
VAVLQRRNRVLVDCHYLGINNVMALMVMHEGRTVLCSKSGGNRFIDLVQQIKLLNEGSICMKLCMLIIKG